MVNSHLNKMINERVNAISDNANATNYVTKPYADNVALNSIKHPRPSFFKRLWHMIKAIFVRPKFSEGAVESVSAITKCKCACHPLASDGSGERIGYLHCSQCSNYRDEK